MLVAGILFGFAWVVAALRPATPGSLWSRWFYDRDKRQRARDVASFRRLAIAGGLIAVLGVVAIFGLLKAYRMPTAAMEPTLRCSAPAFGCTAAEQDRFLAVRYVFRKQPQRGDIVVPDEQYIVLGDNRVQSCDSRPRDRLIARAAFRYWPLDRIGAP